MNIQTQISVQAVSQITSGVTRYCLQDHTNIETDKTEIRFRDCLDIQGYTRIGK